MTKQKPKARLDIIENEDAMLAIMSDHFAPRFEEYRSQRDEFDDKVEVADMMDKMARNKTLAQSDRDDAINGGEHTNGDVNADTNADVASPFANRIFTQRAAMVYAVVSGAGEDGPIKNVPVRNPALWADSTESQDQADLRNTLAQWSLEQGDWNYRQLDAYRDAVKYTHLPVRVTMQPCVKEIYVKDDKGDVKKKKVDIKGYPRIDIWPIRQLWADRNIPCLESQTMVFLSSKQAIVDLVMDNFTSKDALYDIIENPQNARYSTSSVESESEAIENEGDTVDSESETDLRRWDVYAKLRLDSDGMPTNDPEVKPELYWFVGYGEDPTSARWTQCITDFHPDKQIPLHMSYTTFGDPTQLYRTMLSQDLRLLYSADCTIRNYGIDALARIAKAPTLVQPDGLKSAPTSAQGFNLDEESVFFLESGYRPDEVMQRLQHPDPVQLYTFMLNNIREDEQNVAGFSNNMMGMINGQRTSASEGLEINQYSMQPQLAWISYFTKDLYTYIGRQFNRHWEVFGDESDIVAIAGESWRGRPPKLYGEFDIKVDVVDEYIQDRVQASQLIQFMAQIGANQALLKGPKHEVNIAELVTKTAKAMGIKEASKLVIRRGGDASFKQRYELEAARVAGYRLPTNEDDDHETHIAVLEAELLRYKPLTDKELMKGEITEQDEVEALEYINGYVKPHLEEHKQRLAGAGAGGGSPAGEQAQLTQGQEAGAQVSAVLGPAMGSA